MTESLLYLSHESKWQAAQLAANALRQMENPPVRIVLYGSTAKNKDTPSSDVDILITHNRDSSFSLEFKLQAINHLQMQEFAVHQLPNSASGRISLAVCDEEFYQDPYRLRATQYNEYKFILNVKAHGIEI